MTCAVLPALVRPLMAGRIPDWLDVLWWETGEQLVEYAPQAEFGWFDMFDKTAPMEAIRRATDLKWLSSAFAGVDWLPLADLQKRGVVLTNGSGLNANAVAEFAVMSMLAVARGYADIVRGQDRHQWIDLPTKSRELAGSRALVMGYGAIGQAVGRMLAGFNVEVVPMRSQSGEGVLGPDDWRAQIGDFDWIVLAMPGTAETAGMIDADVLAAMKDDAVLVNVARADIIDQDALCAALRARQIGAAILDLTDPEPLPPDHDLWDVPGAHITMHMAGMPTPASRQRAADRFLANCAHWHAGEPLIAQVDLLRGY
ncbi:D-2-hydroxyacid dehydrogenase [Alteraurantiacibacter aestuarii]|uniref:D-2-hydroxyacid dehydrogenase n=1 Tax=Alteraurantiacibacter aestuarii TaxID=650004 RepID=UPI0031D53CE9